MKRVYSKGLISMRGVPSRTSRLETTISPLGEILKIAASCNPIGLGRSGDRVANTPVVFAFGLFLGLVVSVSRSDLSSHVSNITFDPRVSPDIACKYFS